MSVKRWAPQRLRLGAGKAGNAALGSADAMLTAGRAPAPDARQQGRDVGACGGRLRLL